MSKLKSVTPNPKSKKSKPKAKPLFQAHDKFFKIAFQDKENASDFLKAYFLYKNMNFLNHHFEEIVNFIEEHPEKEDLWQTIFTYILGNGELELDIVTNILKNIHSPKIRQKMDLATNKGIFGQAYRQGRDETIAIWKSKLENTQNELIEARIAAENAKTTAENAKMAAENAKIAAAENAENTRIFLTLLHGWYRQADLQFIADIACIALKEAKLWIASFDYIKSNRVIQKEIAPSQWVKLLEKKKTKYVVLSEAQITRLLELLDKTV
jgi:hypothetical protein